MVNFVMPKGRHALQLEATGRSFSIVLFIHLFV